MHTGRAEYERVQVRTNLPAVENPDRLRNPADPAILKAAVTYFVDRGCLKPAAADDARGVRRAVNGGLIGLDDCVTLTARAKAAFAREFGETDLPAERQARTATQDERQAKAAAGSRAAAGGAVATGAAAPVAPASSDMPGWVPVTVACGAALGLAILAVALWRKARKLERIPRFVTLGET